MYFVFDKTSRRCTGSMFCEPAEQNSDSHELVLASQELASAGISSLVLDHSGVVKKLEPPPHKYWKVDADTATVALDIDALKAGIKLHLSSKCNASIEGGFFVGAEHYGCSSEDQLNLHSALSSAVAAGIPRFLKCTNADGVDKFIEKTPDEIQEICCALDSFILSCRQSYSAELEKVMAVGDFDILYSSYRNVLI